MVAAVVAVLAEVIPAEHAARERAAAPAARATATFRYVFTAPNLEARHTGCIANVSQACDTVRDPGTAPGAVPISALSGVPSRARAVRGHGRPSSFG